MKTKLLLLTRKDFFSYLIQPFFYIGAIFFSIFCCAQFFFGQQFFVPTVGSSDLHHFFSAIPYICIIILPVITSQHNSLSFDETLPISSFEQVTSNWLASFLAFFCMLIPLIALPVCVNMFGNVDIGQTVTGFLGILLYAAAALACLLFFTELIPTASYIISTVILACSNIAHIFPLYVSLPAPAAAFFRTVSFAWHFDAAGKGIIDTRDWGFYLSATALFIFLTVYLKEFRRGKRRIQHTLLLIICAIMLLMFDSNRYYIRLDTTKNKQFSVSSYSKKMLSAVNKPLRITYYRSEELAHLYPRVRDIYDFLLDYSRMNSNISIRLVDPEKENAEKKLESYGIIPQQLQTNNTENSKYLNVYSAIVIEYLDKYEIIPFILSTASLEYDLAVRTQHIVDNITRRTYLLCGNGLNFDSDYSYLVPWLENQGISCTILTTDDLHDGLENSNSPLIVFGSSELTEDNVADIERFLLNGGKALFAVSPFKTAISGTWTVTEPEHDALLPLLSANGFEFGRQLVADRSCRSITLYDSDQNRQEKKYPLWIDVLPQKNLPQGMTLYWASPIFIYNNKINPLILSSTHSWLTERTKQNSKSLFETNPFLLDTESTLPTESDNSDQYVLCAFLNGQIQGFYTREKGTDTRIIVISDQYFADSNLLGYTESSGTDFRNLETVTNYLLTLQGEKELSTLLYKGTINTNLYKIKTVKQITSKKMLLLIIHFIIIPLFFIAIGILHHVIRKKGNRI